MPQINTEALPEENLRVFTSDRARADTSAAEAIRGAGNLAETALVVQAKQEAHDVVTESVESYLSGVQAQEELERLGSTDLFEAEVGAETPDVVQFRERAQVLQDAARAGEISTTELKINIEAEMRDMIRNNPAFAPEIQDAANTALGRYSETLNSVERSATQRAQMEEWMFKQIIGQVKEVGIDLRLINHPDPTVRQDAWQRASQSLALLENSKQAALEETIRKTQNLWTERAQEQTAPTVVAGDMQRLKGTLFKMGVPLDDPKSFRDWYESTDADTRAALEHQLSEFREMYTTGFNKRFPNLIGEKGNQIMGPVLNRINNYQKLLRGELTAESLKVENDISTDRTIGFINQTREGQLYTTINMRFPNGDPTTKRLVARASRNILERFLDQNVYGTLPPEDKKPTRDWYKDTVPQAITDPLSQEGKAVIDSFASATNALQQGHHLDPEEFRGFFTVAANPALADYMAGAEGAADQKRVLRENFEVGTTQYTDRLIEAAKRKMARGGDAIAIDASQPDGMIRFVVKAGKTNVQNVTLADDLNNNEGVHWNNMIFGAAHMKGKKGVDAYVEVRNEMVREIFEQDVAVTGMSDEMNAAVRRLQGEE